RFTLEHIAHVDDARWTEFGPGAVGVGWDSMLLGLVLHLERDASITPDKAMEWLVSPEGVRFVTESSEAWCAAAIAAGEEPAAAEAAAKRTTAAYTGAA
ncbi:MAG TPA: polyketide cyclase, partial [Pseudonocardia sp.]|nr:polyketide cyclase [Pseudonocardia sp.]